MGLSRYLERSVVDQSGLDGGFEFLLEWTPDSLSAAGAPSPDTDKGSLFTAVREQLGLKLELSRGPTEVIVVEHAERPKED